MDRTMLMGILGGVAVLLALIFGFSGVVALVDLQHSALGQPEGANLACVEFVVAVALVGAVVAYHRKKTALACGVASLSIALLFGYVGWLVHPDRVIERAHEEVGDLYGAQFDAGYWKNEDGRMWRLHDPEDTYGESLTIPEYNRMLERLAQRLRAAELQLEATHLLDAANEHSTENSWALWMSSAFYLAVGGFSLWIHWTERRSSELGALSETDEFDLDSDSV